MLQVAGQAAPAPPTQAVSAQPGLPPRISQLTGKIRTKKLKISPVSIRRAVSLLQTLGQVLFAERFAPCISRCFTE